MSNDSEHAINTTRRWVENVVVGYNFCPFAKKEVISDSIRYVCVDATTKTSALQALQAEIDWLNTHPETTLLIFPAGFQIFHDYLDLLDVAEAMLVQSGYEGVYQLASFHPDYQFAGESADSPFNLTNRAPFPTLHILRESSISRAVDAHKNAESIPDNNLTTIRGLSHQVLQSLRQHKY